MKIAVLMGDRGNPFWSGMERDYGRLAPGLGLEAECFYPLPAGDTSAQARELVRLGRQGFPAVIVNPLNSANLAGEITRLAQQGVIILDVGSKTDRALVMPAGSGYVPVKTVDFREQGRLGGRFLASRLGPGARAALISGRPTALQSLGRCAGAREELEESGVEVAAEKQAGFDLDQGRDAAAALLAHDPGLAGLFCANDQMALGALQAAIEAGRPDLVVVGVDLIPQAARSIALGGLAASVAFSREEVARQVLKAALTALAGETWPDEYCVQSRLVTRENVGEYLP
jgi:ABC-type sugar transport system substrate-binding protein